MTLREKKKKLNVPEKNGLNGLNCLIDSTRLRFLTLDTSTWLRRCLTREWSDPYPAVYPVLREFSD